MVRSLASVVRGLVSGPDWWLPAGGGRSPSAGDPPRQRRRLPWRRARPVPDVGALVVRHQLDLGRLAAMIDRERRSTDLGTMSRLTASVIAYDRVLLECAQAVGIGTAALCSPLTADHRLDVELALICADVSW
jgi:hypothetical protein